jgi:hypothetical protein
VKKLLHLKGKVKGLRQKSATPTGGLPGLLGRYSGLGFPEELKPLPDHLDSVQELLGETPALFQVSGPGQPLQGQLQRNDRQHQLRIELLAGQGVLEAKTDVRLQGTHFSLEVSGPLHKTPPFMVWNRWLVIEIGPW